ncbi:MAG: sugar phosphate isomerase/epimerase [Armatimonadetes bacterium]|nr:sugar phosphate isomerase/epimerase [Armatimonadota bacterium]
MTNIVACRVGSYGRFTANAYQHMQSIGLRYVEIGIPAPEAVAEILDRLGAYGLRVSSGAGVCRLADPACVEALKPQVETLGRLGAAIMFLSVRAGETPKAEAYARLRALGDVAAAGGVTLSLETHPDLVHNGTVARETMDAVAHPNIRVNFDTGNTYYYNEGADGIEELRKALPYVASVHLKDSNGGFRDGKFPTLGQGMVDFPEVFRLLNARGMFGPFTMELEGLSGAGSSETHQFELVAASFNYLKRIGVA